MIFERSKIHRSALPIFVLLNLAVVLFSCTGKRKDSKLAASQKAVLAFDDAESFLPSWPTSNTCISHITSEPDNLHPTNGNSSPRSQVFQFTQRTLIYIDFAGQEIVPGLITKLPEVSSDGLSYTYELRDGITWDDGKPLSSDDILFTARAFLCPLTNDKPVRFYWENVSDIVPDPENQKRFTMVMKRKHIQNISFLTSFSVLQRTFHDPENALAKYSIGQFTDPDFDVSADEALARWAREFNDDRYGRQPELLNGLGMYKVLRWETGQYITLVRKPHHWTEHSEDYHEFAYPDTIIFKMNQDETSQILQFKSQDMDVSSLLSTNSFLKLKDDSLFNHNYNGALINTYNFTYLCLNERPSAARRKNLFDDVNVRRAVAHLTPVNDLIRLIYNQYSDDCRRMITNVSSLKPEFNANLAPIREDPGTAANLLREAGWSDSDNDGILDRIIDGKKVSFEGELNYLSSSQEWKDMAQLIAEKLYREGIRMNPVGMDLKLFIEKARSHDFDMLLGSWGGTSLPEDYTQLFHTSSWENNGSNFPGFGNSNSDALIDSIKYELNDSLRMQMSRRLQEMIYNDQPYVFLYSSMRRNVIHKRFGNQKLYSDKPGILESTLRLLSINHGITMTEQTAP